MHYITMLSWLIIVASALSCAAQDIESKETSGRQLQVVEDSNARHLRPDTTQQKKHDYAPGEILIKFKQGTNQQTIKAIKKELHLQTIRAISKPNLYLMKILDGSAVEVMIVRLKGFSQVSYSEPNYIRRINQKSRGKTK